MAAEPNKKDPQEFNDDEIDQIMDELDKLQEEMDTPASTDEKSSSEPELKVVPDADEALAEAGGINDDDDILGEFRGSSEDASMEDTVGELGAEETDSGLLGTEEVETPDESPVSVPSPVPAMRKSSRQSEKNSDGCLKMTLTGDIELKLNYEIGGQEVTIGFEDQCLQVKLSDGTEFKIPLKK